jgi:hypothetical protein
MSYPKVADRLRAAFARLARIPRLPCALSAASVLATVTFMTRFFVRVMLEDNRGRVGAPIDDAYIYFNYARQLASGHFFEYNPGDGMTTGATSYLWTVVLAFGYRLGFQGDRLVWLAIGLGAIFLAAHGLLLVRLARRVVHHRLPATALAILVLLDGRVAWGALSGMEVGFYTFLLTAVPEAYLLARARPTRRRVAALAVSLGLLVLIRPEGQVLGAMACALILGDKLLRRPRGGASRWRALLRDRATWIPVVIAGALVLCFYLMLYAKLGRLAQNGMRTKSHLFAPDQTLKGIADATTKFFWDMIFTHFPWRFDNVAKGALDVFVYTGFFLGVVHEVRRRRPGLMVLLAWWYFGGLLLQSIVLPVAHHHGRYVMNYTFMYWLAFAAGVHQWIVRRSIRAELKVLGEGLACAWVAWMNLAGVPQFAGNFGNDVRTINRQHVAMAEYVRDHVPADAVVAWNDVGAGGYYGGHYIVDIYGLTTNEVAARKWDGQACILEEVMHGLPHRPSWFAIYPNWYTVITTLGLLKSETKFHVDPPHVNGGDDMILYSVDWSTVGDETVPHGAQAELARAGMTIVDRMNEAFRPSEIAHQYHWGRGGKDSQWGSDLLRYAPYAGTNAPSLIEGGRTVREWEHWVGKGLQPGKDLWIVRRTAGANDPCEVLVDGRDAGSWEPTADVRGRFRDEIFKVPGALVTRPEVELRFELRGDPRARHQHVPDRGYDVYYVWLAQ